MKTMKCNSWKRSEAKHLQITRHAIQYKISLTKMEKLLQSLPTLTIRAIIFTTIRSAVYILILFEFDRMILSFLS